MSNGSLFSATMKQLVVFHKRNGHCDVRIVSNDEFEELGRWLASQRHQFRKGKLPQDKVDILQKMGVNLSSRKTQSWGE